MEQSKACTKCGQILPFKSFGPDHNNKSGLRAACNNCRKFESASYRARYPEKKKAADKRNYELNGQKIRQRVKQYRKENADYLRIVGKNYRTANKELIANYKVMWRKANPDKFYAGINRRRARLFNAKTYEIIIKDLRRIMNQPCIYCGAKSEQLEHIIPLARGGIHGIGNLAGSCETCNKSKGARFVTEWRYRKLLTSKLLNPSANQSTKD